MVFDTQEICSLGNETPETLGFTSEEELDQILLPLMQDSDGNKDILNYKSL